MPSGLPIEIHYTPKLRFRLRFLCFENVTEE